MLSVDGPKSGMVDSLEVTRLKDEMTSMKQKSCGRVEPWSWFHFLFKQVALNCLIQLVFLGDFNATETLSCNHDSKKSLIAQSILIQ